MKREEKRICPAVKMLMFLGKRHMLLIIHNLVSGPKGFNDLHDAMDVNTATLTTRLHELEEEKVVEKIVCKSDSRRHYYGLTKRGKKISVLIEKLGMV